METKVGKTGVAKTKERRGKRRSRKKERGKDRKVRRENRKGKEQ